MLTILVRLVIVYILLALILRLMGKRQVGELEVTELVAALLLSEISSMVIDDAEKPLLFAAVPIICMLLLEIMISFGITKLPFFKKLFEAKPSILIKRGKLDQGELLRVRLPIEELLGELRLQGVANIDTVEYAIMEQNGKISVILREEYQPLTPSDAGVQVKRRGVDHPLVFEGSISQFNCRLTGRNENFIKKELQKRKCRLDEVFLMVVDDADTVTVILKEEVKSK